MCWALINCVESIFSSKKKHVHQTNQYIAPLTIDIRGPNSAKLIEISNSINNEFGQDHSMRVFCKVADDVQYYQVTATRGSQSKVVYRGPAESKDIQELLDRVQIEVRDWSLKLNLRIFLNEVVVGNWCDDDWEMGKLQVNDDGWFIIFIKVDIRSDII